MAYSSFFLSGLRSTPSDRATLAKAAEGPVLRSRWSCDSNDLECDLSKIVDLDSSPHVQAPREMLTQRVPHPAQHKPSPSLPRLNTNITASIQDSFLSFSSITPASASGRFGLPSPLRAQRAPRRQLSAQRALLRPRPAAPARPPPPPPPPVDVGIKLSVEEEEDIPATSSPILSQALPPVQNLFGNWRWSRATVDHLPSSMFEISTPVSAHFDALVNVPWDTSDLVTTEDPALVPALPEILALMEEEGQTHT